jgi:hypothetical protein
MVLGIALLFLGVTGVAHAVMLGLGLVKPPDNGRGRDRERER